MTTQIPGGGRRLTGFVVALAWGLWVGCTSMVELRDL